jgi:integrase
MGSLRKKTFTKPVPAGAEEFERRGEAFVRWLDGRGRKQVAKLTTGRDGSPRIVIESKVWLAKFRNGAGLLDEISTGCRDKQAAAAVLADLEREAERQRAGIVTSQESAALGNAGKPISGHLDSYNAARRAEGISERQIEDSRTLIEKLFRDCGFKTLVSVQRHKVEEWLAAKAEAGTGARRRNIYLEAVRTFLRWAVSSNRLLSDPLDGIARADQNADVRRERRALTEDELRRLLITASQRPLAEHGRETVQLERRQGKRSSWTYAPLTMGNIDAAIERARMKLADKPELIDEKVRLGRERALTIKMLALTGLRRGELATLRIRNLYLDEPQPFLKLDRKSEKNRKGNTIPLRSDLADDLRQWLAERAEAAEKAAQDVPALNFETEAARIRRGETKPSNVGLPANAHVFNVPNRHALVKILDKDYAVAGIPKIDERGQTVDVHSLRHSFATWIGESGVSPKTAQQLMRHSDVNMTMRYTHGKPETDSKALDALPAARLNPQPPVTVAATGTESLPPMLPPGSGHSCATQSQTGNSGKVERGKAESGPAEECSENPAKQAVFESAGKYTREDSNLQPPVPKTGALSN